MSINPVRILLVDDHIILRKGLRKLIEEQSGMLVVGEASTSQSALEQIQSSSPDIVVMDIHLPDESGIAISHRILEDFPTIKIIALSGDSELAIINEALQAGVSAYVTKDSAPDELMRAILAVLDHRVYLCPKVASIVVNDYMRTIAEKTVPVSKPMLTDRERLLLKLVAEGKRNKEIAESLQVGVKSVETFRSRLMKKLGCASSNELTRYAIREGIVSP